LAGLKQYELKDHLGNVRVVFGDLKTALNQSGTLVNESFKICGELLTKSAENVLERMKEAGWKSGSNGKLYQTKVVQRFEVVGNEVRLTKMGRI
jgi:hypothetical protein